MGLLPNICTFLISVLSKQLPFGAAALFDRLLIAADRNFVLSRCVLLDDGINTRVVISRIVVLRAVNSKSNNL